MSTSLPPDLLEAYQSACHHRGEALEAFIEEARDHWPTSALLALLDRVEEDIQQNIAMMLDSNPALEGMAEARAAEQRSRIAALRSALT